MTTYIVKTDLAYSNGELYGLEYTFSDGSIGVLPFEEKTR